MQVPSAYVSSINPFDGSLITFYPRRPNPALSSQRGGAKNARLRRIITGDEVILTPESVKALRITLPSAPLPNSGLHRRYIAANFQDSGPARNQNGLYPVPIRTTLTQNLSLDVDSWFLGSLDPFSALPQVGGEPIPKRSLIEYCK